MKVMVTGGAGFIGSALCRHLVLVRGFTVLNLDKLTYASSAGSVATIANHACYRFVKCDICNFSGVRDTLTDFQPDAIVHLAAESHVDRSIAGSKDFIRSNIQGTHTLLEAALDYWRSLTGEARAKFRFHHVSTDEVYGSLGTTGAFVETTAYDPRSPYSASKAASDHLVSAWHHTYGLPTLRTNCSNNYGPFQFPEKLIPLITINAIKGKPLPIYGDGRNIRDWLEVDDHVRALTLVLERGQVGQNYNIGGDAQMENIAVVKTICGLLDELRPEGSPYLDLVTFVADRPGHDRRYAVDCTKLRVELGWKPLQTFPSGMRQTVQWYLDNEAWWEPLCAKV